MQFYPMDSGAFQNVPAKAFVVELVYESVKKKEVKYLYYKNVCICSFISRKNTGNSEYKNVYKFHYFITKLKSIQWNKI